MTKEPTRYEEIQHSLGRRRQADAHHADEMRIAKVHLIIIAVIALSNIAAVVLVFWLALTRWNVFG